MTQRRNRFRYLGLVLVGRLTGLLLLGLVAPDVYSELLANIERVLAPRGLDSQTHEQSPDKVAWDSSWPSRC